MGERMMLDDDDYLGNLGIINYVIGDCHDFIDRNTAKEA
jgi:hypothetical protein